MRRRTDAFIGCYVSPRERTAVDEMKRRVGISADAHLIRTALYRFAVHVDINTDPTLFQLRSGSAHAFDCDQLDDCLCGSPMKRADSVKRGS